MAQLIQLAIFVLLNVAISSCTQLLNPFDGNRTSQLTMSTCNGNRKKEYHVGSFEKMNWFKADQFCHYNGMHLASFTSQQEMDVVIELLNATGYDEAFWTSGNDLAREGGLRSWVWMSTGCTWSYKNWGTSEPAPGDLNCVRLVPPAWEWSNRLCTNKHYPLCEKFLD